MCVFVRARVLCRFVLDYLRSVLDYKCSLIFVLGLTFMGRGSHNGIDSDAAASLRGTLSFIRNLDI